MILGIVRGHSISCGAGSGSAGPVDFVQGPLLAVVRPSAWVHRRPFNSLCRAGAVRVGTIDSRAGPVLVVRGRSVRCRCLNCVFNHECNCFVSVFQAR